MKNNLVECTTNLFMPISSESFLEDFPIYDADPSCSLWIPVAPYCQSIHRISDYTRSLTMDELPIEQSRI